MKMYLFIIILIIGAFLVGRFFDVIKKYIRKLNLKPTVWLVVIVAIACLTIGILIGKGGDVFKKAVKGTSSRSQGFKMPFQVGKSPVLSTFESDGDFKKWQTNNAVFTQSEEHVTEGRYSGKMVFLTGSDATNVLLQNFFESNPSYGNWASFSQLKFDIYNAGGDTERLILKIKDANGKAWQRNMHLPPNQNTETKIYIEELKNSIDVSRIRQFNFFRWQPKSEATFYIDNIRLIMGDNEEKAQIAPASSQNATSPVVTKAENGKFLFDSENSDFGLGVETSLEKVFLEPSKFKGEPKDEINISLARNEYESAQLVIYAKKPLESVSLEKSNLVSNIGGKEAVIDKKNISCFIVGYVKTKKPNYSVSYVGWWPDPLEEKTTFRVSENTLQPIWIEVYAPANVPAGEYSGDITIKFGESKLKNVKIKVNVRDFTLPKETHLKTAFDFYDGRFKRAYPKREGEDSLSYKGRIEELRTKYYLDMIKHRIMPVFNFDIDSAFFAKDIKLFLNNGLSTFAIGKYGGSFNNNWPKDEKALNELIPIYRDSAKVLRAANLIDKAYIYSYDEPKYGDPHVDAVTKMLHTADPGLKNMVCLHTLSNLDRYPNWGDNIDIWCVRNVMFNEKTAKYYRDKGKELWIYVSGPEPPYPTLVIDYPAMAYRIVPWQCWKYDIKGYLFWCVNFWEGNPWENPMNTKWEQNGNGFLYYPGEDGPVTSIRLELTRDGMEDYEYFYLLNKKIKEAKDKNLDKTNFELINKSEELLKIDNSIVESMGDYTKNPKLIYDKRSSIAEAIEGLDKILSEKPAMAQTSAPADAILSAQRAAAPKGNQVEENFSKPVKAVSGKSFGDYNQLTFELYRNGTFTIDGKSGFAWQKSASYRDSAIIRSTKPLPETYTVTAVVGGIDYDLSRIKGLRPDIEYKEGPVNENGCYLLVITDELPTGHHTNDWWHQHRKVSIDVDNNIWGSGMPNPIFMVYFDKNNKLMAFDGDKNYWQSAWRKALTYQHDTWYKVQIEKTPVEYILSVFDSRGNLLKKSNIAFTEVWSADNNHPDYLVIGDPHENYYQGSLKIKSISIPAESNGKT